MPAHDPSDGIVSISFQAFVRTVPRTERTSDHDSIPRKPTVNLDYYTDQTRELVQALVGVANEIVGDNTASELEGSASVNVAGTVVAKILPQDPGTKEYVLLGVSSTYCTDDWRKSVPEFDGPHLVRTASFTSFRCPAAAKQP